MAEYRQSLLFFADLFQKLATVATAVDELNSAATSVGQVAADRKEPVSLDEAERAVWARPTTFPRRRGLAQLAAELRQLDVRALTESYWKTVYGIYEVIPHPVDPRAQGATGALFGRFHCQYAMVVPPSPLEKPLAGDRQAVSARPPGPHRRRAGLAALTGWTLHGEDQGETWRASFDEPGIIARDDFQDQGYRWLVVRLTEGPQGGRKTIAVNGQVVGQFVRTGPPVSVEEGMVGHAQLSDPRRTPRRTAGSKSASPTPASPSPPSPGGGTRAGHGLGSQQEITYPAASGERSDSTDGKAGARITKEAHLSSVPPGFAIRATSAWVVRSLCSILICLRSDHKIREVMEA